MNVPPHLIEKLSLLQQDHLLRYWFQLGPYQKSILKAQIESIDIQVFKQQQSLLKSKAPASKAEFTPLQHCAQRGNPENKKRGVEIISTGECGCLLIAGGQGTRLDFPGPKGTFPVTRFRHKTLFQVFSEKISAASKQANRSLPLAIMTSPNTHDATLKHFHDHNNFGLKSDQLFFFVQTTLPFLDESGNLFLECKHLVAAGPDGNGSIFQCFVKAGLWDQWNSCGIKYLTSVLIDNPLADPYDAELIGFHAGTKGDVSIKCTQRVSEDEKVGIIVEKDHKVQVVEYSEMPDKEKRMRLPDGTLQYPYANLSLFCFKMDFIKNCKAYNFPLHSALKPAMSLGQKTKAWKFEKYIFDVLPFSSGTAVINYPREACFAPLKNKVGPDSLNTVQQALQTLDRLVLAEISGVKPQEIPFELSQSFYYPTQELLQKWKNKSLTHSGYIE